MNKTVIIGGVAGGASCAARLRRLDGDASIVLLERGEYISYANCGLPYYTGDVIKSRDALLLQTPEAMKKKYDVDVRVNNEVISIDPSAKTITVKDKAVGNIYSESYDNLVISTGSSPVKPPIPGIDHHRVMTLWTVPDTDKIAEIIREKGAHRAAVIGGGFIGLEMAENLRHAGLSVSLIEALDQVMAPLDYEVAKVIHENLIANGVELHLSDGVEAFEDKGDTVAVRTKSGKIIEAELVILSIGVKPNSQLAKDCGLAVNDRGGIITDSHLRTSDPDIYAVGDVIQVNDLVFDEPTMIPLAGPANKQGRMAADNICGRNEVYEGTQGTSVAKIFDLTAASTGANEKALIKHGMVRGKDYERVYVTQNSHAGYYPGAAPLTIKLLFSIDGKKIFGAQIIGSKGVDKRIDTIATVLRLGGGVEDLQNLELAYAPPFSSAKDPVNMAGFTAGNLLSGLVRFASWDDIEKNPQAIKLDVREEAEIMAYSLEGSVNIPLGQLRNRLGELDKTKEIIIFCAIGVRAYNAARILMENGFNDVKIYPGGTGFYRSTHYVAESVTPQNNGEDQGGGASLCGCSADTPVSSIKLDCSGLQCPGPIMKVFEAIKDMADGQALEIVASDPGFVRDIDAWCRRTGNTLVSTGKEDDYFSAIVRKGSLDKGDSAGSLSKVSGNEANGKTIIVFDGDMDKVLASFIIANGAAAMGRPVTMFFTFWGLTALRKSKKQPVKKTFMESMFGAMLPRGTGKLKLSKMNMGGMGTAMMKKIMNDKNVDSLETMIEKAMKAGIKIVACTMSMDVMGIKEEELIDGVELGGVGAYLGDAEESNVNLFI